MVINKGEGGEGMQKRGNLNEKLFVRILLENISFKDSYEQQKFNRLKVECPKKAIEQVEESLNLQTFTISFE